MLKKILLGLVALIGAAYAGLVLYSYWPKGDGLPVEALARPEDKFATVGGLSIRYQVFGEAGEYRPNVVLMHGFGNSLQSFRELAPRLAACCRVLVFDFPGFGLSAMPVEHDYTNQGQAKTAVAVAAALGFDRPIYGGHSMGGAIAVQAAAIDPGTRALILIDPGILETGVPKAVAVAPFPFPRLSAGLFGDRAWRERFLKVSFVDPTKVTPALMDDLMRTPARDDYWPGATAMMSSFKPGNEVALLPGLKSPVLIVFGEADRNHPDALRRQLHGLLPRSQMIVVRDAGHYPHEEKPDEVAEAVKTMVKAWGFGPES